MSEFESSIATNQPIDERLNLKSIVDGKSDNGIPKVRFIEDIEQFAASFIPRASAEALIGAFSELFSKFKAYETNLSNKRLNFQQKIPEIEKTLNLVVHLKKKRDDGETIVTKYGIADMVYASARLNSDGYVNLWLGANVMLQYTYDDAIDLLTSRLKDSRKEYEQIMEDLAFTRNQSITSEVNMSRIYNWDVRVRRTAKGIETGKS